MTYYGRWMLKNPHRLAAGEQFLHEMRTDKPAASCYEVHFKTPFGRDAAR
jgi:hypothetical protein